MAYNVFVSRYSNNSDIIKNSFSRSTSNAMSAYISNQERYDINLERPILPKLGRDEGEVTFSALLLPSDMPENNLIALGIDDESLIYRVKDRFLNHKDVIGKEHFLLQDKIVIANLWSLSDRNIQSIEQKSEIYKNRETRLRLYNLYLFTSPVAHKHFPPELNVTHEDLREIDERVIYEICDEFFLSKGLAVEIGRHQNKENIIHYHVQTTNRIFKYKYEQENYHFDAFAFKAWLSKSKLQPLRDSVIKNEKKRKMWQTKFDDDPSEYNRERLENWSRKLNELIQEREDIQDIIAGIKSTGTTYSKYQDLYITNQQRRVQSTLDNDSIFSSHKGETEMFLDTYDALDRIKERYAQVLNRHLIDANLIQPGTQLYEYSKSLRDFITVKEGRIWNISDDKRIEINKKLNEVFKMDEDFFLFELDKKGKKKKIDRKKKTRKRLIIHGLKTIIKQHLQVHKPVIAHSEQALTQWVKVWKKQLNQIKTKYSQLIETLLQHHIYNFNWKKVVQSNLIRLDTYEDEQIQNQDIIVQQDMKSLDIAKKEKPSEVVDIEFNYDYEDENELNYETFYTHEGDEEDTASQESQSEHLPVVDFNLTWEMFYNMLRLYEEEIEERNITLDYDIQEVNFQVFSREFNFSFHDFYGLMEDALERQLSLVDCIYLNNPHLEFNDQQIQHYEWER